MNNKQYLDYHRQYMMELPTTDAVLDKQLEITLAFESGKMEEMEYNIKMNALEILEGQMKQTEEQRVRWLNAGQIL